MSINEVIIKFNDMLHDGKHTRDECYSYLQENKNELEQEFYEKHGFRYDMSYSFLYPEMMKSFINE